MKKLLFLPLVLIAGFASGCANFSITSAQAIQIASPLVTGGVELILANNPSYATLVGQIGGDLQTANYADLSVTGINATIAAIAKARNADPKLTAVIQASLDAGLAGYLGAVAETGLKSDPNAQAVLQALGGALSAAASSVPPSH